MPNQTEITFGYPNTVIKQYEHWTVLLREGQVTLGSLVLCSTSEATEFSALSQDAFIEMNIAIADIERVLKAAFNYDKINYLMLMMVDPHVHFHVFPRYASVQNAAGLEIVDKGWPAAPHLAEPTVLTQVQSETLKAYIISFW